MGSPVVVPSSGAIFGKLRSRAEETKPAMPTQTPKPTATPVSDRIHPTAKYGDKPGEKRLDTSYLNKPIPAYKDGTDYVPETGLAMVHEGEKIVPKEDNMVKSEQNPSLYRAMHHLNKGGLHRALGVPEDQDIPADKVEAAKGSTNSHVAAMANMAHTMSKFKH